MKFQLTSRLELNLFDATTNPAFVSEFAIKHRIPTIVTAPEYLAPLMSHRLARGGQYKLIAAIDYPKGKNFAMDKLKRTHSDFVAADGFEILLSNNRTEIELRNEMRTLHSFLKMQNRMAEIRWCLGMGSRKQENTERILKGLLKFPPSYIRTDHHLELPKIVAKDHLSHAELIRKYVPYPTKISGNVDYKTLKELKDNKLIRRFDVSLDQLKSILYECDKEQKELVTIATTKTESNKEAQDD